MARGFLAGVIWGTVVAGLGAGTLSVLTDPPQGANQSAGPATQVPAPSDDASPSADLSADPSAVQTEAPAASSDAPDVAETAPQPGGSDLPALPETDELPAQDSAALPAPTSPDAPQTTPAETEAPQVSEAPAALEVVDAGNGPVLALTEDQPSANAAPATPEPSAPEPAPEAAEPDSMAPAQPEPEADPSLPKVSIGRPAGSLLDREGAVQQSRLPSVGRPADDATEPEEAPARPQAQGALWDNAADVEAPASLPRMSVILIDDGSGPLGPEALQPFPFPVSFALPASHPTAAQTAEDYRALGFEVLVIADLPEGAAASDVEVSLAGALDLVPQAVAVIEDPKQGFGGNRQMVTQVAEYLGETGHGLVVVPKGLNTAAQLAAREGVAATSVFRDFDSEGQDANTIRRGLDQAAFRARQDGAVVMLGRLRADTISALLLWGLQDRSGSLALVPTSTVLKETLEN